MTVPPLVAMHGIVKKYAGVVALRGVDLEVLPGEVMALVGENGAGKSTVLKVLAGATQANEGTIEVDGKPVALRSPRDAQAIGVAVIYQELNLASHLTVAENVFIGREPRTRLGGVDRATMERRTAALLAEVGVDVSPRDTVGRLNVARQQMVEIIKALSMDARLVVMDEPTSSLTENEVSTLLGVVEGLRSRGVGVVYVSHRMREVFQVADRITVLRDGALVGVHRTADTSPSQVVSMMVGRDLEDLYGTRPPTGSLDAPVLEVRNLTAGPRVQDVSFSVSPGEIVGLAGLIGAGRSETLRAVFGMERKESGEVLVAGEPVPLRSPRQAIDAGIGFVPEDRKQQGLFLGLPIQTNIWSASLRELSRFSVLDRTRARDMAAHHVAELQVRCASPSVAVGTLSGGNQQKVVLARWLARKPRVLLLDEPTRGVDIGAKAEIYRLIRAIAADGVGVVVISSELPEVLGISDRILVMREGRLVGEFDAEDATEQGVMSLAVGVPVGAVQGDEEQR